MYKNKTNLSRGILSNQAVSTDSLQKGTSKNHRQDKISSPPYSFTTPRLETGRTAYEKGYSLTLEFIHMCGNTITKF